MAERYRIRIQGHLSHNWTEALDGLSISHLPDGTSLLLGPVADQAALHGILARIRDLGLTLLEVKRDDLGL